MIRNHEITVVQFEKLCTHITIKKIELLDTELLIMLCTHYTSMYTLHI